MMSIHVFPPKKTAWLTRHGRDRGSDGAPSWKEYVGTAENMIKGLTPYQILGKLTKQTKRERYVCWKEGSKMEGQQLYQKIHNSVCTEEPMFINALQGHSGKNLDFSTFFSETDRERGYAPLLYHMGFSRKEDTLNSGGIAPGGFGTNKGRTAVYFTLVAPLGWHPDPNFKPYLHLSKHRDLLFVIDLEAAQNSSEFYQTASGSVSCYHTVPAEFLTKIININDGSERFQKAQTKDRDASPTKKSRRDRNTPRETSGHESKDREKL